MKSEYYFFKKSIKISFKQMSVNAVYFLVK